MTAIRPVDIEQGHLPWLGLNIVIEPPLRRRMDDGGRYAPGNVLTSLPCLQVGVAVPRHHSPVGLMANTANTRRSHSSAKRPTRIRRTAIRRPRSRCRAKAGRLTLEHLWVVVRAAGNRPLTTGEHGHGQRGLCDRGQRVTLGRWMLRPEHASYDKATMQAMSRQGFKLMLLLMRPSGE